MAVLEWPVRDHSGAEGRAADALLLARAELDDARVRAGRSGRRPREVGDSPGARPRRQLRLHDVRRGVPAHHRAVGAHAERRPHRAARWPRALRLAHAPAPVPPEVPRRYASPYGIDLANWQLLAGAPDDVGRVVRAFSLNAVAPE